MVSIICMLIRCNITVAHLSYSSKSNHETAANASEERSHCQRIVDKYRTYDPLPQRRMCACVDLDYLNMKSLYHIFYMCMGERLNVSSYDQKSDIFPWKFCHILDKKTSPRVLYLHQMQLDFVRLSSDWCTSSYSHCPLAVLVAWKVSPVVVFEGTVLVSVDSGRASASGSEVLRKAPFLCCLVQTIPVLSLSPRHEEYSVKKKDRKTSGYNYYTNILSNVSEWGAYYHRCTYCLIIYSFHSLFWTKKTHNLLR